MTSLLNEPVVRWRRARRFGARVELLWTYSGGLSPVRGREAPCTPDVKLPPRTQRGKGREAGAWSLEPGAWSLEPSVPYSVSYPLCRVLAGRVARRLDRRPPASGEATPPAHRLRLHRRRRRGRVDARRELPRLS